MGSEKRARVTVLLFEDNGAQARLVEELLKEAKNIIVHLMTAPRLSEGLDILNKSRVDIILLDLNLPDSSGNDTIRKVLSVAGEIPVIVLTESTNESFETISMYRGVQDYILKKDLDEVLVEKAIRYALERKKTEILLKESSDSFHNIVETSSSPVLVVSNDKLIRFANNAAKKIFDLKEGKDKAVFGYPVEGGNISEIEITKKGASETLEMNCVKTQWKGQPSYLLTLTNITARKKVQRWEKFRNDILTLLNADIEPRKMLDGVVFAIKNETGFDSVRIRLKEGDDFPLSSQIGFSPESFSAGNTAVHRGTPGGLCRNKDGSICPECACGLVASGKTYGETPLFTAGGSFWTNNTLLLPGPKAEEGPRESRRNRCMHEGYLSVAIASIRGGEKTIGLLQISDRKKDKLTLELVRYLENICNIIGRIIERRQMEEKTKENEKKYKALFENTNSAIIIDYTETGILIEANKQAEILFGRPKKELIGLNRSELRPKEKAEYYTKSFQEHAESSGSPLEEGIIVRKDGSRVPVTITTTVMEISGKKVIQGVFQDITELKTAEKTLKLNLDNVEKALFSAVDALASTVEAKDPYTAGHQQRVSELSAAIALEMGYSSGIIRIIRTAAIVHDLGKIHVPSEILTKPGKISKTEFDLIKTHVQSSFDILRNIDFPWPIAEIVYQHHERINGTGYPKGLKGSQMLKEAKIIAVADTVEAMSSFRPYRAALGIEKALEEINGHRDNLYDAAVVDACCKLFKEKKFHFSGASNS